MLRLAKRTQVEISGDGDVSWGDNWVWGDAEGLDLEGRGRDAVVPREGGAGAGNEQSEDDENSVHLGEGLKLVKKSKD